MTTRAAVRWAAGAFLLAVLLAAAPAPAAQRLPFRVGAASVAFTTPRHVANDPADCAAGAGMTGPRAFAYEEPYADTDGSKGYSDGEPFTDCNGNGRWDGNFLGGGSGTPRLYTHVLDPVGARALAVANGRRTIVVEVVDQEGLFNVYMQRIRDRVAKDGVHVDGIFISANHDESAPDTLGLSGTSETSSSVNAYFADHLVERSALAIERAVHAMRPARIRFAQAIEAPNLRQCWSSYPFVDDQLIPSLQATDARGRTIATVANISQHDETLGFNHDASERLAVSSDWLHWMRADLEHRLGGVAIAMSGSVGSVETPQVFPRAISRVAQEETDADHPAGCRTLFRPHGTPVALGYRHEDRALAESVAGSVAGALRHARASRTNVVWGARADVCIPLTNFLFKAAGALGVFAARPVYTNNCRTQAPLLPNGSTQGDEILSQVAAFRIGDGEFMSVPGEVFPFTYLRSSLGPDDLPRAGLALPAWPLPHMHAPFRFVDGLAEDMVGYIFPAGNSVGIPGENGNGIDASDTDRFGCNHSDDSESTGAQTGNLVGAALVRLLDRLEKRGPERIVDGRYVLPGGARSRDPLGQPVLKCTVAPRVASPARPAIGVFAGGHVVHPHTWIDAHGRPQSHPDRNTRGYLDARGRRVWVSVF